MREPQEVGRTTDVSTLLLCCVLWVKFLARYHHDMDIYSATSDVKCNGGGMQSPPNVGFASNVLPEVQEPVWAENLQSGVSTRNALSGSTLKTIKRKPKDGSHWYALRVTYGREKKVYDYLFGKHVEAYYPTIKTVKEVDGKRKTVEESRLPNILFARGTEEEIKSFVYDNVNLPHLRFYYRHFHEGARLIKEPLIVPDYQIEGLKIICASEAEDVVIVPQAIQKFQTGQTVRVIDGVFTGVIGKVARYHGQQRVAIFIDGLLTIASAYVPSAFLEVIKNSGVSANSFTFPK